MSVSELRVHGVSGTPPRDMLYSDPVESQAHKQQPTASQRYVKVFRRPSRRDFGVGSQVKAFHWGGLTSGSWLTAFWVLMLPFSMGNLAGWTASRRSPGAITGIRLFGLLLTGVFLNMALITTLDVYWQGASGDGRRLWAAVIVLGLGLGWWAVVSWASTRSHFEGLTGADRRRFLWHPDPSSLVPREGPQDKAAWEDPSSRAVTDSRLWDVHPILHRLRRIHFGFGFLMLAYATAVASDTGWEIPGVGLLDIPTLGVLVFIVFSVGVLVATGMRKGPAPRWLRVATALQPWIGVTLLIGSLAMIAFTGVEVSQSGHWPHLRDTSAVLLGLAAISLSLVWALAGRISAAALTLGAFFGLVMGAGAVFGLEGWIERDVDILGLAWLAAGVLIWMLTALVVVLIILTGRIDATEPDLWKAVHKTTGSLRPVFFWLPAAGLFLALAAVSARCADIGETNLFDACFQTGRLGEVEPWLGWAAVTLVALAWLLIVTVLARVRKPIPAVLVLILTPAAVWFFRDKGIEIAGIPLSYRTIEEAALTFAILLPASLILARLISGLRGTTESRRGTSVIWDVVMFWPRWFHPLAPPAYGPHAVSRLRAEVSRRLLPDAGGNRRPLILAAHSQGTILSTVAVATLAGAEPGENRFNLGNADALDRLGLITYGCPLAHLYDNYFPGARFGELAECLGRALGNRWVNLYRPTDPIGGPVLDSVDLFVPDPVDEQAPYDRSAEDSPLTALQSWLRGVLGRSDPPAKPIYRGHSHYEPSEQFREKRDRIAALL